MSNFAFLKDKKEFAAFAAAAIEAERVYSSSPAMCAIGCRKALELAVKWVYAADCKLVRPYKDNLSALIHEYSFRFAMAPATWNKLPFIVKLGNLSVHTEQAVRPGEALEALKALFTFIDWIDYCYGADYAEKKFDEAALPAEKVTVDTKKIKEQESLLGEKQSQIESLLAQIASQAEQLEELKALHQKARSFTVEDITEFATRKTYIDVELKLLGWKFGSAAAGVVEEFEVDSMNGVPGQKGYADYVLFGRDGLPLAVVEAKRTSADPNKGREQARLYADCLERRFGRRPVMFTTNGFETYYWDDKSGPQRAVSGLFSRDDLEKLVSRRTSRRDLTKVTIDDRITDRYYQKNAIRAVCDRITQGFRKHLLVMATGTGKTRTASSLTDALSRGGWVTNVLFLADRTALVKQAKDDFRNYLPDMSLCNLCSNKDDKNARIVFSTYPTMMNAIDRAKDAEGKRLFSPAHFDLIVIDESHRSIFRKYRAIFDYFDAYLVGLTATPKTDVDRNTYDFFEMEQNIPTFAYDYDTAVNKDHVLVPFSNVEVKTKFLEEGITYDDLSDEDKARYEDDFAEDGSMPDFIPSAQMNKFVFNINTVDTVLQELMEKGIKTGGGDMIGKSIVFAQNKKHAEFIVERFNALYPQYHGEFAKRVVCDDAYVQSVIDAFKKPNGLPRIAVSVDMMDTGIDVPECVNLVFFKKVRSRTKFWQMIGRGTRLCKNLECVDAKYGAYMGKRHFMIFDYCGNFEFFRTKPRGFESKETKSLTEHIFCRKVSLIAALQDSQFAGDEYQSWRKDLVSESQKQIEALNPELFSVKMKLRWVEKFKAAGAFTVLSEGDRADLQTNLAPLVFMNEADEAAKRFDNFMYGLMLGLIGKENFFQKARRDLCKTCELLEKKTSIPQVKEKLPLIKAVQTDDFWDSSDVLAFENVRRELRLLIQFLDSKADRPPVITDLQDEEIGRMEGEPIDGGEQLEDYRERVNRYILEHPNVLAIHKLTHNIPLTAVDYGELERIFTIELGTAEDYRFNFGDTPFGLLVRKVAKLDHEAAMAAFSEFINDESLNAAQIAFVEKVIGYVENNGYLENSAALLKAPFDRPVRFISLFDEERQKRLNSVIAMIHDNAVRIEA